MSTTTLTRLLVPTDFSDAADVALKYATALADVFSARAHRPHRHGDAWTRPMAHLLIGSVAEKVVRRAPCPVLTVPLRGHDFATL